MNDLTFIQLRRGHEEDRRRFESLMVRYFRELDRHQGRHTDPEFLRNVTRSILSMQGPHDRHLELCYDGDSLVGFWYGKVDHPEHKGFIKPGYGYIMEFYVIPAYRRQGYGTAMFRRLHGLFASHGVKRLYLTADPVTGKPFWEWIGFQNRERGRRNHGCLFPTWVLETGRPNRPGPCRFAQTRHRPATLSGSTGFIPRAGSGCTDRPYRFRSGERFCRRAIPMNGITSSL